MEQSTLGTVVISFLLQFSMPPKPILIDMQLIRYFTCGPDEVQSWTIRKGTKAPQAAGVIQCLPSLHQCFRNADFNSQFRF
jgi:hypothetical protein